MWGNPKATLFSSSMASLESLGLVLVLPLDESSGRLHGLSGTDSVIEGPTASVSGKTQLHSKYSVPGNGQNIELGFGDRPWGSLFQKGSRLPYPGP